MTSIPKQWAAALVLAAFVGCTKPEGGEPAATNPSPTVPGPAPETPPSASPSADVTKPGMSSEALPPEPKVEAPKVDAPVIEAPRPEPPKKEGEGEAKDKAAAVSLSSEEVAEIRALPADEQAVALKQAVCPVSDEHLGSMGAPIKVSAEGKTFYLCCKGCKKEVDADPKAVVAKLNRP